MWVRFLFVPPCCIPIWEGQALDIVNMDELLSGLALNWEHDTQQPSARQTHTCDWDEHLSLIALVKFEWGVLHVISSAVIVLGVGGIELNALSHYDSFLFSEPLEVQLLTAFVVLSIMHMPFRIPEGCLIA